MRRVLFACIALFVSSQCLLAQQRVVTKSVYTDVYNAKNKEVYNNWWHPRRVATSTYIIQINTQTDFDAVQSKIDKVLRDGYKDITVRFGKGSFYFKNEHIILRGDSYPDASVHFVGNGTTIIPTGHYYKKGDIYRGDFNVKRIYLDNQLKDLNIWSQMYHSDSMVEVLDVNKKLCRIHSPEFNLSPTSIGEEAYLQLTEWYLSEIYKITSASGMRTYTIRFEEGTGKHTVE